VALSDLRLGDRDASSGNCFVVAAGIHADSVARAIACRRVQLAMLVLQARATGRVRLRQRLRIWPTAVCGPTEPMAPWVRSPSR
jgi:hypothetical protein